MANAAWLGTRSPARSGPSKGDCACQGREGVQGDLCNPCSSHVMREPKMRKQKQKNKRFPPYSLKQESWPALPQQGLKARHSAERQARDRVVPQYRKSLLRGALGSTGYSRCTGQLSPSSGTSSWGPRHTSQFPRQASGLKGRLQFSAQ